MLRMRLFTRGRTKADALAIWGGVMTGALVGGLALSSPESWHTITSLADELYGFVDLPLRRTSAWCFSSLHTLRGMSVPELVRATTRSPLPVATFMGLFVTLVLRPLYRLLGGPH